MIDKTRYAAEYKFALRVLSFYTRLIPPDSEASHLGGKLLYAGDVDDDGRALIAAANIAGAGSLCATANAQEQKQAVRDGIVDFLVNSLDEALRIVKNEIRKHAPVAVCIAAPPAEIESQMVERGVLPDIERSVAEAESNRSTPPDIALVAWSVSSSPARWMPRLDAFALECAGELPEPTRRWLQMSPRHLGRLAQSIHLVLANQTFAASFAEPAMGLEGGKIPLKIQWSYRGGCEEFNSPNWDKDESLTP